MSHKFNFDPDMSEFFSETKNISRVSGIVDYNGGSLLKKNGDFFKRESLDTISYISKAKLSMEHSGFEEVKYRTNLKVGRFIGKFIGDQVMKDYGISNYDIEIFVNIFKSYFDRDETKLKIVEGDDILQYYSEVNYHQASGSCYGPLWASCMRYQNKNRYMEIYAKNPDKVKMLVLLDDNGKVKTRALLWEECSDVDGNKYKVMDRIYSVYDHDMIFFKDWAFKNGYIHKLDQSARSENLFMTPQGPMNINLIISLDNHICDYYPYIDSFKYYSKKNGTLANSDLFLYKYILVQNNGGLKPEEREEDDLHNDEYYDDDYDGDHEYVEDNWA